MTRIVQIGLCAADLPRAVRRYVEVFGFEDAGGRMTWGPRVARIQQLGDDSTGLMWWLVGKQKFFQLELFHHSSPAQRPLPADWSCDTLGWVRWGVAVDDFDGVLARLARAGVVVSDPVTVDDLRRCCFRDPDFGIFVEVMEDGPALKTRNASATTPRVVYAALSVPDLDSSLQFYVDAIGMQLLPDELHPPAVEALWGLKGAQRRTAVLDGEGVLLELVQYTDPVGVARTDRLHSDQGIMNIAVGWRERDRLVHALERAVAGGGALTAPLGDTAAVATYVMDPHANSLEMLAIPDDPTYERAWGWTAVPSIMR